MRPIEDVAADLGLAPSEIIPWGPYAAKVQPEVALAARAPKAKLVLVSAISPTPAGEGKTTCTIGLTQAARRLGVKAACALREPSLGPIFGQKGGGTGGGRSQLVPSERINLHFTGDLHAITSANNLLAALVDNHLANDEEPRLDSRQITWHRALDMNDRFLRKTVIGLGGKSMGVPREDGFDITAASEVMAVLCLSSDYEDLKRRLGEMLVGYDRAGKPVRARELPAIGAMAALLRDALLPNVVQTAEGAPALVHGGPFANIAHGCNSLVATRLARSSAEVVFTEAGFGFDLGGEKFLDIKCRTGGLWPDVVVLVATLRALKFHGGVAAADAGKPDREALTRGIANLDKHLDSVRRFGLEPIVALNLRAGDPEDEQQLLLDHLKEAGVQAGVADIFERGGEGALELAERVIAAAKGSSAKPRFLYDVKDAPIDKIRAVAQNVYGADDVALTAGAATQLRRAIDLGYGQLPVCMAKTHLSLSDDPKRLGRPKDFTVTVRELRIAAGAGFLVALTGEILTMPGLPKQPAAVGIDLRPDGTIVGVR